jgi:hypothetical protein
MRKRLMLIAAPLCVVAIAASVAVAAPSDTEHAVGPKLDKLHAERPIAASSDLDAVNAADAVQQVQRVHDFLLDLSVTDYLKSLALTDYLDSLQAQEAAQAAATPPVSTASQGASVSYSSNPGGFLSCVRQRESGGNYGVYNSGGSGAAGAYQFLPGTWNSVASSSGRGDLVGVDPAQASPGDQDAMAQALYAQQGAAPWGGGC